MTSATAATASAKHAAAVPELKKPSARARTLQGAFPIVASAFGRKCGVKVLIEGTEMKTNGSIIWLPSVDPDDENLVEVMYGVLAHECGHVRFTDFSVFAETTGAPLRKSLLNIVEDGREELLMTRELPGTAKWLNRVIEWLVASGMTAGIRKSDSPVAMLANYALHRMRGYVLGQKCCKDIADADEVIMLETFPQNMVSRLHSMLDEIKSLASTREALELADRILAMLEEEKENAENPPPPSPQPQDQDGEGEANSVGAPEGGGEDQDDGSGESSQSDSDDGSDAGDGQEDGDPAGAGDAQSDGKGNSPDQEPSESPANAEGDGSDDGTGGKGDDGPGESSESGSDDGSDAGNGREDGDPAGAGDAQGDGKGNSPDQEPSESPANAEGDGSGDGAGGKAKAGNLARALDADASEVPDTDTFGRAAKEIGRGLQSLPGDQKLPAMAAAVDQEGDPVGGQSILTRVMGTTAKVRTHLQGLVEAHRREDTLVRSRGTRMDNRRMHRAMHGDPRVFVQRIENVAPNTAVHILVDRSGSMANSTKEWGGKTRLTIALESSMALASALEGIPGVNAAVTAFPFSRAGSVVGVLPVVKHGQRVRQRVSKFAMAADGGTPLAEAVLFCASELLRQKEERRLMLVVTDGQPDCPVAAKSMIDRCTRSGIEMIGIGIVEPRVQGLFPVSAVLGDVSELQGAMFDLIRRKMIGA